MITSKQTVDMEKSQFKTFKESLDIISTMLFFFIIVTALLAIGITYKLEGMFKESNRINCLILESQAKASGEPLPGICAELLKPSK